MHSTQANGAFPLKTNCVRVYFKLQYNGQHWRATYIATFLGRLSNDDGDVNENGKKAKGLDWQNKNFARASRFFVNFFAVTAWLRREHA